jgi:hypothetical protein
MQPPLAVPVSPPPPPVWNGPFASPARTPFVPPALLSERWQEQHGAARKTNFLVVDNACHNSSLNSSSIGPTPSSALHYYIPHTAAIGSTLPPPTFVGSSAKVHQPVHTPSSDNSESKPTTSVSVVTDSSNNGDAARDNSMGMTRTLHGEGAVALDAGLSPIATAVSNSLEPDFLTNELL